MFFGCLSRGVSGGSKKAFIDPVKIRHYIFSPLNPVRRFKAALFKMMGYTPEAWELFAEDIRKYHLPLDAEPLEKTSMGKSI